MLPSLTKEFGLIFCCIYSCYRLLNKPLCLKKPSTAVFLLAATLEGMFINSHIPQLTFTALVITVSIFLVFREKMDVPMSFTTAAIAFGLSYLAFAVSVILVGTLLSLIIPDPKSPVVIFSNLLLHLSLIRVPFLFRRTKKGMPFLCKPVYAFPGFVLSLIILLLSTLVNILSNSPRYLLPVSLLYAAIIVFHLYWRSALTKTYIDRLNEKKLENLNATLRRQQKEIQQLESENQRLARILHKDNKLIPSMEYAVRSYLQNASPDPKSRQEGAGLLDELSQLSRERQGLLAVQDAQCEALEPCGIPRIDHLLHYMQQRAAADSIQLHTAFSHDARSMASQTIGEDALHTLVADLVENALIATRHNRGRHVFVKMDMVAGFFSVHVLDCGLPFPIEVLQQFGKRQVTTHADESGSGIGLMELYRMLKKYRASLYIDEFDDSGLYTKKLSVVFNRTGNIVLYTSRPREETAALSRKRGFLIVQKQA